jgi:hypothetical protein
MQTEDVNFDIPAFSESVDLDAYASETINDENDNQRDGDGKPEKLTSKAAKLAIVGAAEMLTGLVGTVTKTDASLSPMEYEDVADKLAPAVLKVVNSEGGLPKWLEQLLKYSPYFMAGFGVLMFGVSVRAKVLDEKFKQAEERREMKDVNKAPQAKAGADNGDKSE